MKNYENRKEDSLDWAQTESPFENIFARLRHGIEVFTRQQKKVCSYILENYQQVVFQTVEELAAYCEVSPATIIRTCRALGYEAYKDMISEFSSLMLKNNVPVWWELEQSWESEKDEPALVWVARDDVEGIQNSITPQLLEDLNRAVDMLSAAREIFILGIRSSRAAAVFFHSMLSQIIPNSRMITYGTDELYDHLVDLKNEDLMFCFSHGGPHYAKSTIEALAYASKNNIPTILITNSPSNPGVEFASLTLYSSQTQRHYSLVPSFVLVEALIVELGQRKKKEAQKKLRKLEEVLVKENIAIY